MRREIVLDNEVACVWYYPDEKIMHHKFKKFIHGEAFQNVMLKAVSVFEKNKATKWLSDDRNNPAFRKEDRIWGDKNWAPRALKTLKYWAMLMPEKILGKMNEKSMLDEYAELGVITEVFDNPEDALEWLCAQ
jgi:hypothetical protein